MVDVCSSTRTFLRKNHNFSTRKSQFFNQFFHSILIEILASSSSRNFWWCGRFFGDVCNIGVMIMLECEWCLVRFHDGLPSKRRHNTLNNSLMKKELSHIRHGVNSLITILYIREVEKYLSHVLWDVIFCTCSYILRWRRPNGYMKYMVKYCEVVI